MCPFKIFFYTFKFSIAQSDYSSQGCSFENYKKFEFTRKEKSFGNKRLNLNPMLPELVGLQGFSVRKNKSETDCINGFGLLWLRGWDLNHMTSGL